MTIESKQPRVLAEGFFNHLAVICNEHGLTDMLDPITNNNYHIYRTLHHDKEHTVGLPKIRFLYETEKLTVHIIRRMKPFFRRINLEQPEKFRTIIEQCFTELNEQNRLYNETKQMLLDKIHEIPRVTINYINKVGNTWYINIHDIPYHSIGMNTNMSITIYYNIITKKFSYYSKNLPINIAFGLLRKNIGINE